MPQGEERLRDNLERTDVQDFLLALALCNSVFVDSKADSQELVYQASSPDDEALVLAASRFQVTLISVLKTVLFTLEMFCSATHGAVIQRVGDQVTVRFGEKDHVFQILAELPFDSDRKRFAFVMGLITTRLT